MLFEAISYREIVHRLFDYNWNEKKVCIQQKNLTSITIDLSHRNSTFATVLQRLTRQLFARRARCSGKHPDEQQSSQRNKTYLIFETVSNKKVRMYPKSQCFFASSMVQAFCFAIKLLRGGVSLKLNNTWTLTWSTYEWIMIFFVDQSTTRQTPPRLRALLSRNSV